jgi:hypothetical protein
MSDVAAERMASPRSGWLTLAAASLLACVVFGRTVVENDLFWHLAIGRHLELSGFPRTDPFGIGTEGLAWSPPEWLSEWVIFRAHELGGLGLLGALHAALVMALGALVFLRARHLAGPGGEAHALVAVALAALPASVHLGIRPLLVGHVLSALVLLELARDRRGPSLVPVLPLLFVLWANLHPSWPLGAAWIALEVLGRLASGPLSRRFPGRFSALPVSRALLAALLLAPAAALLRPDGLDGFLYPFVHVIGLGDRMGEIIEWFPLSPTRPLHVFVVLLCALALALGRRRRAAPPDLLVALASTYLLVRHQRFLPLALIGVAPLLAASLPALPSTEALRARLASLPAVRALGLTLALAALLTWPRPSELAASIDVLSPVGATDALARLHPAPRVFTTFEDGGYVAWRLPGARVFVDSRFDLYARAGVFDAYLALRAGGSVAPLLGARFDAAILPTPSRDAHFEHVRAELAALGWREIFGDENAVLLVSP